MELWPMIKKTSAVRFHKRKDKMVWDSRCLDIYVIISESKVMGTCEICWTPCLWKRFFLERCSDFKCDVHRLMCFHTWSTARDTMEGSVTFRIWNLSLGEVCHSGTTMRFIPWLLSGWSLLLNCRCREIHCPHSPAVLSQPWWTVSSLNCKPK